MPPSDIVERAASSFLDCSRRAVLTGAGISVDCGIPDFRGREGLWSKFDPDEYATLEVFLSEPDKAWKFYRSLGHVLWDKVPGPAHLSLADLERQGLIDGIVTQNIDGLHGAAGSRRLVEIHGDFRQLQCLGCQTLQPVTREGLGRSQVPLCPTCGGKLKPNVVLFGEPVRSLAAAEELLAGCDALLLVGTSGSVFPVAEIPMMIAGRGGLLIEFNIGETPLSPFCTFSLHGRADSTVPAFARAVSRIAALR